MSSLAKPSTPSAPAASSHLLTGRPNPDGSSIEASYRLGQCLPSDIECAWGGLGLLYSKNCVTRVRWLKGFWQNWRQCHKEAFCLKGQYFVQRVYFGDWDWGAQSHPVCARARQSAGTWPAQMRTVFWHSIRVRGNTTLRWQSALASKRSHTKNAKRVKGNILSPTRV